jgi:hypothetical protein
MCTALLPPGVTPIAVKNISISINMGDYTHYIIHAALMIYVVAAVT